MGWNPLAAQPAIPPLSVAHGPVEARRGQHPLPSLWPGPRPGSSLANLALSLLCHPRHPFHPCTNSFFLMERSNKKMKVIPKNNRNQGKSPNLVSNLDSILILHDFQLEKGLMPPYDLLGPIKDLPDAVPNTFPRCHLRNPPAAVTSPIDSLPCPTYWMRSTTGVPRSFHTHASAGGVTLPPVAMDQDRRTRHAAVHPSGCRPKPQLTQGKKPLCPLSIWSYSVL
jgi:hypothetical protein